MLSFYPGTTRAKSLAEASEILNYAINTMGNLINLYVHTRISNQTNVTLPTYIYVCMHFW